jgi:hypothetical protein
MESEVSFVNDESLSVSDRQIASADEQRSVEDDAGGHTRLKGVIIYWLNELLSLLAVELHFKGLTEIVKKLKQLFLNYFKCH